MTIVRVDYQNFLRIVRLFVKFGPSQRLLHC